MNVMSDAVQAVLWYCHRIVIALLPCLLIWSVELTHDLVSAELVTPYEKAYLAIEDGVVPQEMVQQIFQGGRAFSQMALLSVVYLRKIENNPALSIDRAASYVLQEGAYRDWKKKNALLVKKFAKFGVDFAKNRSVLAKFPEYSTWKKGSKINECAIELASGYLEMGAYDEALKIADGIGSLENGVQRALAGECVADTMLKIKDFQKSIKKYKYSLKVLAEFYRKKSTSSERVAYSLIDSWIKKRIDLKVVRAQRLWDIQRYGPQWVLYREAQLARLKEKDYLAAVLLYEEIADKYKETIFLMRLRVTRLNAYCCCHRRVMRKGHLTESIGKRRRLKF